MIFNYPISAYALCYGPLAVMIIGFVGFALLTDAHARRTYLRDMDPRTDDELTAADILAKRKLNRTLQAEIPTGARVAFEPDENSADSNISAPPIPPAPPAAPPAPVVTAPVTAPADVEIISEEADDAPDQPDDLTMIDGIGSTISSAFISSGVDTFEKLSQLTEQQMRVLLDGQNIRFSPAIESFQEQASLAAAGDWDGLKALQNRLEGGRYPRGE